MPPLAVKKTVQALAHLAHRQGGTIPARRAALLLYFADRLHLRAYGRPLFDNTSCSTPDGPLGSIPYCLTNRSGDALPEGTWSYARRFVDIDEATRRIHCRETADLAVFSQTDREALAEVFDAFRIMSDDELAEHSRRLPEWGRYRTDRLPEQVTLMTYEDYFEATEEFAPGEQRFSGNPSLLALRKESYQDWRRANLTLDVPDTMGVEQYDVVFSEFLQPGAIFGGELMVGAPEPVIPHRIFVVLGGDPVTSNIVILPFADMDLTSLRAALTHLPDDGIVTGRTETAFYTSETDTSLGKRCLHHFPRTTWNTSEDCGLCRANRLQSSDLWDSEDESTFNCNVPLIRSVEHLRERFSRGGLTFYDSVVGAELRLSISKAILNSPVVENEIKNILTSYPMGIPKKGQQGLLPFS